MNTCRKLLGLMMSLVIFGLVIFVPPVDGTRQAIAANTVSECWTLYAGDDVGAELADTHFNAMAVLSKENIWAVGNYRNKDNQSVARTLRWDGSTWKQIPIPNIEDKGEELEAITAIDPDDIWATGTYYDSAKYTPMTLILHWDGVAWKQVSIPKLGSLGVLNGISATSKQDIWAVGEYTSPRDVRQLNLILHWDGAAWEAPEEIPSPGMWTNELRVVAALSVDNAWAVGKSDSKPVLLHWNGNIWSEAPAPDVQLGDELTSIAAVSPSDIWVAGTDSNSGGFLIEHWDGASWASAPVVSPNLQSSSVTSLAVVSSNDIWLIGNDRHFDKSLMLVIHWDGHTWNSVPNILQATRQDFSSRIDAGAVDSDGDLWMVGAIFDSRPSTSTLIRRANALCLPPTPVATPSDPPATVPGDNTRLFPETGQTISGLFLDYWQQNGGLAQQGYPISGVIGETSPLDGKVYSVQYFERAIFEYHPENKSPYNILLSQLGAFEYNRRYPQGAPGQKPDTAPGSRLFHETGKRVGGRFLEYWNANGGLRQQGYPVSDEFTEVNPSDGKSYTVQYFERAVFELHPENKAPYDVLLGLLGRFRYDSYYGAAALQAPQLIAQSILGKPSAGDRFLLWSDSRAVTNTLRGYDFAEKREFLIPIGPVFIGPPVTNDKIAAWVERTCVDHASIFGYDFNSLEKFTILEKASDRFIGNLAIDANMLYYRDDTTGHRGVFSHDLLTGEDRLISEQGENPVAADGKIVWVAYERACPDYLCAFYKWQLHLQAPDGSVKDTVIAISPGYDNIFTTYSVSGDNVVWSQRGGGPYLYNISSGSTRTLSTEVNTFPVIKGNIVVWADDKYLTTITVYNITTNQLTKLNPSESAWITPQAILGERTLVYGSGDDSPSREGRKSLYILSLDQTR